MNYTNITSNLSTEKKGIIMFSETKLDFKISWRLYLENFRVFIGMELLLLLVILVSAIPLTFISFYLFGESLLTFLLILIYFLVAIFAIPAFLCSQYGLSYNILSSGNMYAEFQSIFSYFKKYWWQYICLVFVQNFFDLSMNVLEIETGDEFGMNLALSSPIHFLIFIITKLWFILFALTFPSLTAQGSLKGSFIENFRILKKDYKHILTTMVLFTMIFEIPLYFLEILVRALSVSFLNEIPFVSGLIMVFLFVIITVLIEFPIMTLILTRVYNTVEFEPFKLNNEDTGTDMRNV